MVLLVDFFFSPVEYPSYFVTFPFHRNRETLSKITNHQCFTPLHISRETMVQILCLIIVIEIYGWGGVESYIRGRMREEKRKSS